ncbi:MULTISPECIES: phage portal protein [Aeromonas]|uniref:phage portal protein n=1 Tax=Aeromonas TaxID=642 RepID=UPI0022E81BC4|nr:MULTISPECIES: phage portal protein [Aeromonas]
MFSLLFGAEARSETISSSDPGLAEWFGLGAATESGVSVTPASSMRLAAVYSCIHRLASAMAQMPIHVLRKEGGNVVPGNDHPAHYLLSASPNMFQSSYDWREQSQQTVLAHGNAVTRLIRDRRTGQLTELVLFEPEHIGKPQRGQSGWYYPAYDDQEHRWFALPIYDAVHIKGFGADKLWGASPIRYHAETIGLGLATKKYGSQFFGGGGRPSGILIDKTPNMAAEQGKQHRANLKSSWREGGIGKGSGRTALLTGDLDYKAITIPPEEAQFLETQKMNRSEVAGIYNVPSYMINDLDRATFSNISEQAIHFVRQCLMPWIVRWEQEINRKVFTEAELRAGYYVKFNLAGLLRGTAKERAEFYHYAITDGWMNRNEVRVLEDMNRVDGLDNFLISVNAASQQDNKQQEDEVTNAE